MCTALSYLENRIVDPIKPSHEFADPIRHSLFGPSDSVFSLHTRSSPLNLWTNSFKFTWTGLSQDEALENRLGRHMSLTLKSETQSFSKLVMVCTHPTSSSSLLGGCADFARWNKPQIALGRNWTSAKACETGMTPIRKSTTNSLYVHSYNTAKIFVVSRSQVHSHVEMSKLHRQWFCARQVRWLCGAVVSLVATSAYRNLVRSSSRRDSRGYY